MTGTEKRDARRALKRRDPKAYLKLIAYEKARKLWTIWSKN
jgi:hypothetical protein